MRVIGYEARANLSCEFRVVVVWGGGCPDGVIAVLGRCPMWYMVGLSWAMLGRCWGGAGSVSVSGRCWVGAGSVPSCESMSSFVNLCQAL